MGEAVVRFPASAAFQKSRTRREHREYDAVLGDGAGGRRKRQLKPVRAVGVQAGDRFGHVPFRDGQGDIRRIGDGRRGRLARYVGNGRCEHFVRSIGGRRQGRLIRSGEICRAVVVGRRLQTQRRRKNDRVVGRQGGQPVKRQRRRCGGVLRSGRGRRRQTGAQRRVGQPASGDFVRKAAVGKAVALDPAVRGLPVQLERVHVDPAEAVAADIRLGVGGACAYVLAEQARFGRRRRQKRFAPIVLCGQRADGQRIRRQ